MTPAEEALTRLGVPTCGRCNRPTVHFFVRVPLRELAPAGGIPPTDKRFVWMELTSGSAPHSKRFVCSECRDAVDKQNP